MQIDVTYVMYWLMIAVLAVKIVLFAAWAWLSGTINDRRYRMSCVIVLMLSAALLYLFSMNLYARALRHDNHLHYIAFMGGTWWGWRVFPILILVTASDVYLVRWAWQALSLYRKKKRRGQPWIKRS